MKPTLVIASANPDKVAELRELLGDRFDVVARPDDAPDTIEDQPTLLGNATKKAVEIMQFTGLAALADDTGLFVDALDGRPGVFTARYAGENATYAENVAKLLHELDGVTNRRAEFRRVSWSRTPMVVLSMPSGLSSAISPRPRPVMAGLVTIPCSCPTNQTAARLPRWTRPKSIRSAIGRGPSPTSPRPANWTGNTHP
ncbi:MAG: non-canonical purine NTP pyrophosphatase [Acidimicrobiales bacterium]